MNETFLSAKLVIFYAMEVFTVASLVITLLMGAYEAIGKTIGKAEHAPVAHKVN
ncbi:MAG: hypothetical protein JXD18_15245 [Anaerolineae bacterium]|nr:hypothetical protein [Anaerolineae bacterium]